MISLPGWGRENASEHEQLWSVVPLADFRPLTYCLSVKLGLVAAALENGYYSRLRRYYATQREHHQPLDQAPPAATLQDLSNDHLPF